MGIIQKIAFGDWAGVDPDTFLGEMRRGEWTAWNTPQKYEKLDGKGRKLMLYDRTREAIVAEVEIRKVEHTKNERDFPWTNFFAPDTLRVYPKSKQTPLGRILRIPGFENFGTGRSSHWNVTHEQYRQMKEQRSKKRGQ